MATNKAQPLADKAVAKEPPKYFTVRLAKVVEYRGQVYRPGIDIVADEATVAAFGDKVLSKVDRDTEHFYERKSS